MTFERPAAVLFDLGNTLVGYYRSGEFEPVLRRCVTGMLEVVRERAPHRAIDFATAFERARDCNRERDDGRVWPFAERCARIFGLGSDETARLREPLTEAFLAPVFALARPDPDAIRVLREIKSLGIKCAIVSNTPWGSPAAPWRAELAGLKLLAEVDAAVFCVDAGWRKPAPQVFAHALQVLDVPASAAWFVGDDARWDVEGARGAGLEAWLIAPAGESAPAEGRTTLAGLPALIRHGRSMP